jgi:hypothetical protein
MVDQRAQLGRRSLRLRVSEVNVRTLGFELDLDPSQGSSSHLGVNHEAWEQSEAQTGHGRIAHDQAVVDPQRPFGMDGDEAIRTDEPPVGDPSSAHAKGYGSRYGGYAADGEGLSGAPVPPRPIPTADVTP